jgi:hypothetical protein
MTTENLLDHGVCDCDRCAEFASWYGRLSDLAQAIEPIFEGWGDGYAVNNAYHYAGEILKHYER